jgi:hypothetical protein
MYALYGKPLAVRWQQQAPQEIKVLSCCLHQLRNHSGAAAPHAEEREAAWRPQLPSSGADGGYRWDLRLNCQTATWLSPEADLREAALCGRSEIGEVCELSYFQLSQLPWKLVRVDPFLIRGKRTLGVGGVFGTGRRERLLAGGGSATRTSRGCDTIGDGRSVRRRALRIRCHARVLRTAGCHC